MRSEEERQLLDGGALDLNKLSTHDPVYERKQLRILFKRLLVVGIFFSIGMCAELSWEQLHLRSGADAYFEVYLPEDQRETVEDGPFKTLADCESLGLDGQGDSSRRMCRKMLISDGRRLWNQNNRLQWRGDLGPQ
jgi:hypothetical protein